MSFKEYERRVREADTDFSNVPVGKTLNTRETDIIDIDQLIDEMSDNDELSGLSSSPGISDESADEKDKVKKRKKKQKQKGKRRRTTLDPIESSGEDENQDDNDDDDDDEEEEEEDGEGGEVQKTMNPNELRNRMVQHLEEMRLAKQRMKRSKSSMKMIASLNVGNYLFKNDQINRKL